MSTIVLETPRLRLRHLTLDDAPFMLELLTDPTWIEFIGDRGLKTVEEARVVIQEKYIADYEERGFGLFGVEAHDHAALMGICGLIKRDGLDDVDLGFAFLPRYVGNGYATESAAAILDWGRVKLGLRRIVAITTPNNVRSIRVLEKVGFKFEKSINLPGDPEILALYAVA